MKLARNIFCGLLILDGIAFITATVFFIWESAHREVSGNIVFTALLGLMAFGIPFGILQQQVEDKK